MGLTSTTSPAIARNGAGYLEIFASDFRNGLIRARQLPGGGWSGWTYLGITVAS